MEGGVEKNDRVIDGKIRAPIPDDMFPLIGNMGNMIAGMWLGPSSLLCELRYQVCVLERSLSASSEAINFY